MDHSTDRHDDLPTGKLSESHGLVVIVARGGVVVSAAAALEEIMKVWGSLRAPPVERPPGAGDAGSRPTPWP